MRCGPVSPARNLAPDPALVGRFKAALDRLNPSGGRIGLAVSGGPDSMAMLLLAQAAIPGQFEVATVNHGLRPEAADECALVARVCGELKVPCFVLTVQVHDDGNLQDAARFARYLGLYDWADRRDWAAIATAHHADDQAETLLMRLNRGSGVAGLAGIRDENYPLEERYGEAPVIRPLLQFRRAELLDIVTRAAVPFVTDPSNADDSFDRVRIRKALADADWLDPVALARSASLLADADRALGVMARDHYARLVTGTDDCLNCQPIAEREIGVRVLRAIIDRFGGAARGGDVARLLDGLARGKGGNVGGVLATVEGGAWVFRPEPPRRTS